MSSSTSSTTTGSPRYTHVRRKSNWLQQQLQQQQSERGPAPNYQDGVLLQALSNRIRTAQNLARDSERLLFQEETIDMHGYRSIAVSGFPEHLVSIQDIQDVVARHGGGNCTVFIGSNFIIQKDKPHIRDLSSRHFYLLLGLFILFFLLIGIIVWRSCVAR